ncbi:MAG TPA: hypothetical protein VF139_14245 [Candidatus Polarisedimenticolaceae bacterium]
MKRLGVWMGSLAVVTAAALAPAAAEVAAELDASGAYLRTVVLASSSAKNVRIWTKVTSRPNLYPVNLDGDLNGDLWPVVAEQTVGVARPWLVWSRFTGVGFDLSWSRFDAGTRSWLPLGWVESEATAGDDLDPAIDFDSTGRPFLVWWRDEAGVGQVYLSLFLQTRWMAPFRVSDAGIDSVAPTITMLSDSRVRVDYTTSEGTVSRTIEFHRPLTITDDATPFGRFTVTASSTISPK